MNPYLFNLLGGFIGDSSPQADPRFANAGITVDENGQLVDKTGSPIKDQSGVLPYKQPSFGTRMFHPQVAYEEGAGNTAFQLQEPEAMKALATQDAVKRAKLLGTPAEFLPSGMTPQNMVNTGFADANTPEQFSDMLRTTANIRKNLPATQSATDITQGATGLAAAQHIQQTQPTAFEIDKANLVNKLAQTTKLDPILLANEVDNAVRTRGRLPTENETQDILSNVRHSQAQREQQMEQTRTQMTPFAQEEMRNEAAKAAYLSRAFPTPTSPVEMRIRNGEIGAERAPGFIGNQQMQQMQAMQQGLPQIPPKGVYVNGKPIAIGGRYSALTGEPVDQEPITAPSVTNTPTMDERIRRLIQANMPPF